MISGIEFGVDNVKVECKDDLLNISFTGKEEVFDKLMEDDDFTFSWALNPPKMYFYGISLDEDNSLTIDFDSEEECALYMMEHSPLSGTLVKTESEIRFSGEVELMGKVRDLSFCVDI